MRRPQRQRLGLSTSRGAPAGVESGPVRACELARLVEAESAVRRAGSLDGIAEQARSVSGSRACWLLSAAGESARAGAGAEDALARSLATACLEDGRDRSRGDLVAVRGEGPDGRFSLVLLPAGDQPDGVPLSHALAGWVGLRLRDLTRLEQDGRAARAELRALRAQISPHFTFNALGAIAATLRVDPDRARGLLLDFADYTRYSFGRHGDYTTLAEELRAVETYLALERARFGDRLRTRVLVPPELLAVQLPFLVLQPLVENAVRHGVETTPDGGTVSLVAYDDVSSVRLEIEDDGPGMEPAALEAMLDGETPTRTASGFGLRSVDERLRAIYGDSHGLVVQTAPGAGMKVIVRIAKYHPEVHG